MESRGRQLVSGGRVLPVVPTAPPLASPTSSYSSPAMETCTSAQKSELAGSQLLGCQASQSGAGGTSPTSKDKGLGAGPEELEGRPCPKACAPETDKGRSGRGREEETGHGRGGDRGGGRAARSGDTGHHLAGVSLPAQQVRGAWLSTPTLPLGIVSPFPPPLLPSPSSGRQGLLRKRSWNSHTDSSGA